MANVGVQSWFNGKNIFITGASGFLGVALLEKILRTLPNHGDIYLMLREKKGKAIQERIDEIKKNSVFEKLYETRSADQIFQKVKIVAGDVGVPDLGLSTEDRKTLTNNVNVIFHSAATLDFADTLKQTVDVNLLGTRRMIALGRQCKNLNAFVHVSSAYVNAFKLKASEEIYPLNRDAENVIAVCQTLSDAEIDAKTPEILGNHPNTYTITKHMAEHEVQNAEEQFPCAIVRPSMIIGAVKEPMPGWTISKNGPQGFMMGAAKGIIRRLPVGKKLVYDYIPVDIVVNNLLAAAYHAGSTKTKKVEVYHATSSTRNAFKWENVESKVNYYLHKYPLKSAVWYPHLKFLPSITWYKISSFFVHILPAIILDTVTRISGGRPILMKLHKNVNNSLDRLERFIFTEWEFRADNTEKLQEWLNKEDKTLFNVDVGVLNWNDYFEDLSKGSRIYLNKEPMKNLEKAKGKDTLLMAIHLAFQGGIYTLLWYIFACILGTTMSKTPLIVPVLYVIFSFL